MMRWRRRKKRRRELKIMRIMNSMGWMDNKMRKSPRRNRKMATASSPQTKMKATNDLPCCPFSVK